MLDSAVSFRSRPPYKSDQAAREKIFALADRRWGNSVCNHMIEELFDHHLHQIVREDRSPRLKEALETIITRICNSSNTSNEWEPARRVTLAARGASLWTDNPAEADFSSCCSEDIIAKILCTTIDTRNYKFPKHLHSYRLVSKKWNRAVEKVWRVICQDIFFDVPPRFQLLPKLTPRTLALCQCLDLRGLEIYPNDISWDILPHFPAVKALKFPPLSLDQLHNLCPNLEELELEPIRFWMKEEPELDLSKFTKLEYIHIKRTSFHTLRVPPSIRSITMNDLVFDTIIVPDEARVESLKVDEVDFDTLDLRGNAWKSLKELNVECCGISGALHFPERCDALEEVILGCLVTNSELRFAPTTAPMLKSVHIRGKLDLILPDLPCLDSFAFFGESDRPEPASLSIKSCPRLTELVLKGVTVHLFPLPNTLRILTLIHIAAGNFLFPRDFPELEQLHFTSVAKLPPSISLTASKRMESSVISRTEGLKTVDFPASAARLESFEIQESGAIILNGVSGEFRNLEYFRVRTTSVLGLKRLDFSRANRLKMISIGKAPELSSIELPRNSPVLKDVMLNGVNLDEFDSTHCSLIKLEYFQIKNQNPIPVNLGKHPRLKAPLITYTNPAPKKKQKTESEQPPHLN